MHAQMPQASPAGSKYVAWDARQGARVDQRFPQLECLQLMANAQQAGQVDNCPIQRDCSQAAQSPAWQEAHSCQMRNSIAFVACMGHMKRPMQYALEWKIEEGLWR